jgi:hypothetical protein
MRWQNAWVMAGTDVGLLFTTVGWDAVVAFGVPPVGLPLELHAAAASMTHRTSKSGISLFRLRMSILPTCG